jgi:hypothetical protein
MFADSFDFFLLASDVLCCFDLYSMQLLPVSTVFPQVVHLSTLESTVLLLFEFPDIFSEIGWYFTCFFNDVGDTVQLSLDEFVDIFLQSFQGLSVGVYC